MNQKHFIGSNRFKPANEVCISKRHFNNESWDPIFHQFQLNINRSPLTTHLVDWNRLNELVTIHRLTFTLLWWHWDRLMVKSDIHCSGNVVPGFNLSSPIKTIGTIQPALNFFFFFFKIQKSFEIFDWDEWSRSGCHQSNEIQLWVYIENGHHSDNTCEWVRERGGAGGEREGWEEGVLMVQ